MPENSPVRYANHPPLIRMKRKRQKFENSNVFLIYAKLAALLISLFFLPQIDKIGSIVVKVKRVL